MLESVNVGINYRNKKNGKEYLVLARGKNTEGDQEDVIIYTCDELDFGPQTIPVYQPPRQIWVRPLWLFKEKFEEVNND